MSAPKFVPTAPGTPRNYESPPRRPESWTASRPGELAEPGQPTGPGLGRQGPDQGYVLTLVRQFEAKLQLTEHDHPDSVNAGCAAVALKRASLFGRAPVVHDLDIAYTVWGYLDDEPPADLVVARTRIFEGVHHQHHGHLLAEIADRVPDDVLALAPAEVGRRYEQDWRSLIDISLSLRP